jgi:transcriptional regulator with XRE-family HTH domain
MCARIYANMNTMARIRKQLFRETQSAFGAIARTSQATVSRWETGELDPTLDQLCRIRAEARRRRLPWKDAWFFQTSPRLPAMQAGGPTA